ncbi:MAG: LysR substrate-binding domain-containing protein [Sphingomonas sp.]
MTPRARRPVTALGVRTLAAFAEVMRTGSVTAAARNLGMTQPGVSRMLALMENAIGFELFYRDRGKLVPTNDGLAMAEEVEFALAGLERVNSLATDIGNSAKGELRIVAPPSVSEGLLPQIVASFLERFPGVRFNLDSRSIETAKAMIATRVVDCGFLKLPIHDDELSCEPLVSSGSVCVLVEDHPLAAHAVLTPELLRGQPLILLGSGRHWRIQGGPGVRRIPVATGRQYRNTYPWFGLRAGSARRRCRDRERTAGPQLFETAACRAPFHTPHRP